MTDVQKSGAVRPDAVAIFVLCDASDDPRLLALRRARGAFRGAWTPVMGTVEPGETAVATARRELREETGIAAAPLYTAGILDAFYDPVGDRIVHVPLFVARVEDERVVRDDAHDEHRWLSFGEAAEVLTFGAHRGALTEIRRAFVERAPEPWRALD